MRNIVWKIIPRLAELIPLGFNNIHLVRPEIQLFFADNVPGGVLRYAFVSSGASAKTIASPLQLMHRIKFNNSMIGRISLRHEMEINMAESR